MLYTRWVDSDLWMANFALAAILTIVWADFTHQPIPDGVVAILGTVYGIRAAHKTVAKFSPHPGTTITPADAPAATDTRRRSK